MVAEGGKPQLIAAVSKDLTSLHAGKIIRPPPQIVGGGGGGRSDLAQAGGRTRPGWTRRCSTRDLIAAALGAAS